MVGWRIITSSIAKIEIYIIIHILITSVGLHLLLSLNFKLWSGFFRLYFCRNNDWLFLDLDLLSFWRGVILVPADMLV